MAEYDRMVKEILLGLEWHKNLVQYSLLFTGSAIAAIQALPLVPELYLVASVILSSIGWMFAEQSYKMLLFGRYIALHLKPQVTQLVDKAGGGSLKQNLLGFDDYFRQGDLRTALAGFPAIGKFVVAVLPGFLFALAYLLLDSRGFNSWTRLEQIRFVVVVAVAVAPLLSGLITLPFFMKHKQ